MSIGANLLVDPVIGVRLAGQVGEFRLSMPALFVAMDEDRVVDFPALRPHQRHPWHALLVQLAALAEPLKDGREQGEDAWRASLRRLTPGDSDDSAWCLISPPDHPAFLQAPVASGDFADWTGTCRCPDELDMLVTSRNHDLKAARMVNAEPQDWLFALVSLQTQDGFLGAGNYGISRMNGGFASRCGVGIAGPGGWGRRWRRDVNALHRHRNEIVSQFGLRAEGGLGLVWLRPWDGRSSLPFAELDPFYVEICRRVRLLEVAPGRWLVRSTGSKVARIVAESQAGKTGDPWMPIDVATSKALTITREGFHYGLAVQLAYGGDFARPAASRIEADDPAQGLTLVARGVTRGKGKTEGLHERRVPLARSAVGLLRRGQGDVVNKIAKERVSAIEVVRSALWGSLCTLLQNGSDAKAVDAIASRAGRYANEFETREDRRFFDDLNLELDASDMSTAEVVRDQWLLDLEQRARSVLHQAFESAPRSGIRRYQARSAALERFQGLLRGPKSRLPRLALLHQRAKASQTSKEGASA